MAKGKIANMLLDEISKLKESIISSNKISVYPEPKTQWGSEFDKKLNEAFIEARRPYAEPVYNDGESWLDLDAEPIGEKIVYPDIDPIEFARSANFKMELPQKNTQRFLSQSNIDNIYDMYVRGVNRSSILDQMPPQYTSRTGMAEDFTGSNIEDNFNHILEQTYKSDIAKRIGVDQEYISVEDSPIARPYITNISTGEMREFDGVVNPLEVLILPKRVIANEFYSNPNKLIRSSGEFQKNAAASQKFALDEFLLAGDEAAKFEEKLKLDAIKNRKNKFSLIKNDSPNLMASVAPVAVGIGYSALTPDQAQAAVQQSISPTNSSTSGLLSQAKKAYDSGVTGVARGPINSAGQYADYADKYNQWRKTLGPIDMLAPVGELPQSLLDKIAYGERVTMSDKIKAMFGLL